MARALSLQTQAGSARTSPLASKRRRVASSTGSQHAEAQHGEARWHHRVGLLDGATMQPPVGCIAYFNPTGSAAAGSDDASRALDHISEGMSSVQTHMPRSPVASLAAIPASITAAAPAAAPSAPPPRSPAAQPPAIPTDGPGVAAVARALKRADRVLILAGAGFTEGSTRQDGIPLPDYRTPGAFAKQYPPLAALGLGYRQLASTACFQKRPAEAWGFYGSRTVSATVASAPSDVCAISRALHSTAQCHPHTRGAACRWADRCCAPAHRRTQYLEYRRRRPHLIVRRCGPFPLAWGEREQYQPSLLNTPRPWTGSVPQSTRGWVGAPSNASDSL